MNGDILESILALIPEALFPKKKDRPLSEMYLEKDFGIYGDDAAEFIEKFSEKFNVDISDFEHSDYFTPETPFYFFYKLFSKRKRKDIRIKDLEIGVIKGKLPN
ncbi:MAG: DUF1493 family protein [Taibaiella sp.]|jgi:hypothetical protein